MPPKARHILYNSDTTNIFFHKGKLDMDTLLSFVDEAADAGADTFLLCQGGQTFFYPSQVGEHVGQSVSASDRESLDDPLRLRIENLESFLLQDADPFLILTERIKERGMEALLTFRLNEGHTIPIDHPGIANFWREHPEWRLSSADPIESTNRYGPDNIRTRVMNFGVPQVRERRLAEIREAMINYPFDGLELDFLRWPFFFLPDEIESNVGTMTRFVVDVRDLLTEIGQKKDQRLVLGVRLPPTLDRSEAIGLDPIQWCRKQLVDFIVPSLFFKNKTLDGKDVELDIAGFQRDCPGIPLYGCIGYTDADDYRKRAASLWEKCVDGIYLFNFFSSRQSSYPESTSEPPFHLVNDLRSLQKAISSRKG